MEDQPISTLREARQALDEVIAEIQRVPGFADFLATPSFDDVAAAAVAAGQPLAYLTAAEHGGLALVVRGAEVKPVDLPDLGRAALAALAEDYLTGYREFRDDPGRHRPAWAARLADVTGWLWPRLMGPLLAEIGDAEAATLIPGGLLGLLPLHAAWHPDETRPTGREHAMDRLVLSYAPNARSLRAASGTARQASGRRTLAIATPAGPRGLRDLPLAREESLAACAAAGGGTLLDRNVTVAWVLAAMGTADVVHFACHGRADLAAPLDSGLIVAPGEVLTVRELMSRDLRPRLAVLSACETLVPGTDLPDEVVSLPTGLLQAGAAGVIASLWAVPDLESAALMVDFYGRWHGGTTPARALRDAQVWVRDTSLTDKYEAYSRAPDWIPEETAEALLDLVTLAEASLDAGASPGAATGDMVGWAAFAHVGV